MTANKANPWIPCHEYMIARSEVLRFNGTLALDVSYSTNVPEEQVPDHGQRSG